MDLINLILLIFFVIFAIFSGKDKYVFSFVKKNKNTFIERFFIPSTSLYFFLISSIVFILIIIDKVMNYNDDFFYVFIVLIITVKYIISALSESYLYIYKDRIIPSNCHILFSDIESIEIEPKNKRKAYLIFKRKNSFYRTTFYNKDKKKIIDLLHQLNIDFIK